MTQVYAVDQVVELGPLLLICTVRTFCNRHCSVTNPKPELAPQHEPAVGCNALRNADHTICCSV